MARGTVVSSSGPARPRHEQATSQRVPFRAGESDLAARRAIHPARQVMTHRLRGPAARP
jgi:hypothetical protein